MKIKLLRIIVKVELGLYNKVIFHRFSKQIKYPWSAYLKANIKSDLFCIVVVVKKLSNDTLI